MKTGDIMAKQRKKRKIKNSAPPLSKLDKAIYSIATTVSLVLILGFFLYGLALPQNLAISDENVVLYAERWTLLLILPPFLISLITIGGFFEEAMSKRIPISKLFKKKSKRKLNDNEKKFYIKLRVVLVILCILSFALGIGGIFGRTCLLNNGYIQVYSITNSVKNEYALGDYTKITIEYGKESVGKHDWRPACYFNIEADNGKEFDFCMNDSKFSASDIDKNLQNMLNLKDCYESQGIDVAVEGKDKLEELIEYYEMNDSEIEMLYELFEIE